MPWEPLSKPAEIAENRLLAAILDGSCPIDSSLPGERDLAAQIGVTRPTLREALQRLARDGWLDIQHGKPTRVRDYWREGSLAVLAGLAQSPHHQSPDFIASLLEVRQLIAPEYARQALAQSGPEIAAFLRKSARLDDDPAAFARFDWELHHLLTQKSPNPIYRMLLNSFEDLYLLMGSQYFAFSACRQHSRDFYAALLGFIQNRDIDGARALTEETMRASLDLWRQLGGGEK